MTARRQNAGPTSQAATVNLLSRACVRVSVDGGSGSGTVVKFKGIMGVLTNAHVVKIRGTTAAAVTCHIQSQKYMEIADWESFPATNAAELRLRMDEAIVSCDPPSPARRRGQKADDFVGPLTENALDFAFIPCEPAGLEHQYWVRSKS